MWVSGGGSGALCCNLSYMLVLLGPSFAGGDAEYQRLSKVTGLVAYDLRSRVKPGMWGLVKARADEAGAERSAGRVASGGGAEYQRLSKVTGLVAYGLRSRVKPGMWGLVKALADEAEAERLAGLLRSEGFPIVVVPREVASDPERPIVALRALEIDGAE